MEIESKIKELTHDYNIFNDKYYPGGGGMLILSKYTLPVPSTSIFDIPTPIQNFSPISSHFVQSY